MRSELRSLRDDIERAAMQHPCYSQVSGAVQALCDYIAAVALIEELHDEVHNKKEAVR